MIPPSPFLLGHLRIVSEAGQRAGLEGVNFDAIRFARVRAELQGRTDPLRVVAGTLGYAAESAVLRAGGRFSKE